MKKEKFFKEFAYQLSRGMILFYAGLSHVPFIKNWANKKCQQWLGIMWGIIDYET